MAEKFIYYPYAEWAAIALIPDPMGVADPELCRQSYIMAASDRGLHWRPRSEQRAAVKAVGGAWVGRGEHLRYTGVVLVSEIPGSTAPLPPKVIGASLSALRDAGLITNEQAIMAALDLTKEER